MKDDYARLIKAANDLKGWKTQSDIAAGLDKAGFPVSAQRLTNWKSRGIAKPNYGAISRIIGCRPLWLEFGEGDMTDAHAFVAKSSRMITDVEAPPYVAPQNVTRLPPPDANTPLLRELLAVAETMNETGQQRLIGQALLLASMHPKVKANPAS